MKYGTFVPSFDVASICSTTLRDASNRGASVLSCDAVPRAASASQMLLGVRNPVTLMNASFVFVSAADDVGRHVVREGHRRAGPRIVGRARCDEHSALHVLVHVDEELVLGGGNAVDGFARTGLEDRGPALTR